MKPKALEGFCGYGTMTDMLKEAGYEVIAIDNDPHFKRDGITIMDILDVDPKIARGFDFAWFSTPCTGFSVASIGTHWGGGFRQYVPKTDTVKLGLKLLEHSIKIIAESEPIVWFIENPRGVMRKVIEPIFKKHGITNFVRRTVTYCQYGDKRMKPTDIWTNNHNWNPKPMCKNGDDCHVPAPRGAKTGTQGLKGARERSALPEELCREIVDSIPKN